MSYQIFARKFRPQSFKNLIGQETISMTLRNAIRQERIPQSFLFSGPRGVGKTSTARILAKALNCTKAPTEEPCGKCTSCTEITQGNSMDVLEIDGASNRGIDEIRNLRETVKFKPSHGRYKIYIIDEVHMLTTEAFNALLKTLEEPPEHVKFIFATTESHKVPLTVLSRCQRFNFKRIPTQDIVKKLETIAKEEGIKYDKNALYLIAKASEGALRDAESLLDQLATFSQDKIREEDVLLMLGLASDEVYLSILTAIIDKDAKKIFSQVHDFYHQGGDVVQLAKGLFEIFRHLLLFQCAEDPEEFVDMSQEAIGEMEKRKSDFSRGELLLALSLLQNLQTQLRRNLAPPKLLVETVLLKLLHLGSLKSVKDSLSNTPVKIRASGPGNGNPVRGTGQRPPTPQASFRAAPPAASIQESPAAAAQSAPAAIASIDEAGAFWPRVIDYVKSKRMSTGIFLSESEPVEIEDGIVTLGLPAEFQFHKETLEKDANRRLVEEAFEVVSGGKVRVQFVISKISQERTAEKIQPAEDEASLPDIIQEALNIFEGAKIIRKE
ncbi:MAG TPA: DNA polymerase III subunit gamma/tau [bacterium]|nr:DNA polymerase III subunit gamma/tau [bacterium]